MLYKGSPEFWVTLLNFDSKRNMKLLATAPTAYQTPYISNHLIQLPKKPQATTHLETRKTKKQTQKKSGACAPIGFH